MITPLKPELTVTFAPSHGPMVANNIGAIVAGCSPMIRKNILIKKADGEKNDDFRYRRNEKREGVRTPTQIDSESTKNYQIKFYKLNRSQVVLSEGDSIYYVTVFQKNSNPPKYERIFHGKPEIAEAIANFVKKRKDNGEE